MTTISSARAAAPKYRLISDDLEAKIRDGFYPLDATLPTEHELCSAYDASRHTVREALRVLAEKALVVRRQKAGTRVIAREQPVDYVQRAGSGHDLLTFPEGTYRNELSRRHVTADAATARLLLCPKGTPWFRIRSLRLVSGSDLPISWSETYILPAYADYQTGDGRHEKQIYAQIEEKFGDRVENARIEIAASRLTVQQATLLDVPPDVPAIRVLKRYFNQHGRNFETSLTLHPEKRFTYHLEVNREPR